MVRYCDTFSGMGGFSLAAHAVFPGSECVWACDFDREVSKTFEKNFGVPSYGNIREKHTDDIPDHDILFGGFPCQPFSQSGKWRTQVGESEDRDNLFLELVRILKEKKPSYFVFENVDNLLRMTNKDGSSVVETIVWHLNDAGYDVVYDVLDAKDFGVPQSRERVFFVGALRGERQFDFKFPAPLECDIPAIADIMQPGVDEKYLIRNAWGTLKTLDRRAEGADVQKNHDAPQGTPRWEVVQGLYDAKAAKGELPTAKTGRTTAVAILYGDTPSGKARRTDKIYSRLGISPTVIAFSGPAVDSDQGLRLLTPRECARLQGFEDDYKLADSDHSAYKQVGNAVCVNVVAAVLRNLRAFMEGKPPVSVKAEATKAAPKRKKEPQVMSSEPQVETAVPQVGTPKPQVAQAVRAKRTSPADALVACARRHEDAMAATAAAKKKHDDAGAALSACQAREAQAQKEVAEATAEFTRHHNLPQMSAANR